MSVSPNNRHGEAVPAGMDTCVRCKAPIPPETLSYRQADGTWRVLCMQCGQWQLPPGALNTGEEATGVDW